MTATTTRTPVIIPFTIGEQFATFIAYGESDHLDNNEVEIFEAFEAGARSLAKAGWHFAHWDITEERDEFARCEATAMMGACLTVNAVYFKDPA